MSEETASGVLLKSLSFGFSATNPCHLYPMTQVLAAMGVPVCFYCGYPRVRLARPRPQLVLNSTWTLPTYALLRVPQRFRLSSRKLFRWQDSNFDRWVGRRLRPHRFIQSIPGQARATFRSAKNLHVPTILNHATGPTSNLVAVLRGEYERVGLKLERATVFDDEYFEQEAEEYALADFHCVASTLVAEQLKATGIEEKRIWILPYGADPKTFYPGITSPNRFRILFAGQISLRKSLRDLLLALEKIGRTEWELNCYGLISDEAKPDLLAYRGRTKLNLHGPVGQSALADAMRNSSVLILPSLEDGFGLVVVQALACGTPCIVSNAVGAKDLVKQRVNGSVFPVRNIEALCEELIFWSSHPTRVTGDYSWRRPADQLLTLAQTL